MSRPSLPTTTGVPGRLRRIASHRVLDYGAAAASVKTSVPMCGEEKGQPSSVRGLIRLGRGGFVHLDFTEGPTWSRAGASWAWWGEAWRHRSLRTSVRAWICMVLTLSGTAMTTMSRWGPDGLEDSNDTLGQRTCACAGVTMTKQQAGGEGAQGETVLQLTLVGAGRKGLTYPG